jgi:hypothetical protein
VLAASRRTRSPQSRLGSQDEFTLGAKHVSSATDGKARISSAACLRYSSLNANQILRYRDLVGWIQAPTFHEHAFAFAEVDSAFVEALRPGMLVTIGKEQEQPLDDVQDHA